MDIWRSAVEVKNGSKRWQKTSVLTTILKKGPSKCYTFLYFLTILHENLHKGISQECKMTDLDFPILHYSYQKTCQNGDYCYFWNFEAL